MTAEPFQAGDIFDEAIRRRPGRDREEYLEEACGTDAALRQRVERLLLAADQAGSFLESPAADPSPTVAAPSSERPGDCIGPYKLLQQIGEGGMGVVYMAEQTEPIERRVAVKVIKPGMDTRQVIARFEAERQALAMMDHPNIARALDAGVTDSGRSYFVMELVKGVPITEYCDEHHLTPRERLELFVPVCQAIQHAHQKGVIHRDIKPSNVLVAHYDDRPVPKVIDFGVAKAIDNRLTEKTLFTQFGQVLGTFEYMSPEQARLNQWDVDTRTDIYSLGVLLYELLAGETPFDRKRLHRAAMDELLRIIREEEPPRPSTRANSSQSLPTIAANRRTEPAKLGAVIRGELDWIVMKALEKDRARRYVTASNLAEDVEHYLNNETVEACPPSSAYRLRKFVRRHWAASMTFSAVTAALLLGTAAATWQGLRAAGQRDRAIVAESVAETQAQRADIAAKQAMAEVIRADAAARKATAEAERAERELVRANEVKRLFRQMLESVAPEVAAGADTRLLSNILDRTARHLNEGHVDDRLVTAEMHYMVGRVYEDMIDYPKAKGHLLRAVNIYLQECPDDVLTAWAMNDLGKVCISALENDEAEKWLTRALEASRGHVDERLLRARILANLAELQTHQGSFEKAKSSYLEALALNDGTEKPAMRLRATIHHGLGSLLVDLGSYDQAEEHLRRALALKQALYSPTVEHLKSILTTRVNLVCVHMQRQEYDEARASNEEIHDLCVKMFGETHDWTLNSKVNLANSYLAQDDSAGDNERRAKVMFQEVVDTFGELPSPEKNIHAVQALTNANLGLALVAMREDDQVEAEARYRAALQHVEKRFPKSHPSAIEVRVEMAKAYFHRAMEQHDQKAGARAAVICEEAVAMVEASPILDPKHATLLAAKEILGTLSQSRGDFAQAERWFRELQVLSESYPFKYYVLACRLGGLYEDQQKYDRAIEQYRTGIDGLRSLPRVDPQILAGAMCNLGLTYYEAGRYSEARDQLEETLRWMDGKLPREHDFRLNAVNGLAHARAELNERGESLSLFREYFDLKTANAEATTDAVVFNDIAWQLLTHDYEELRDAKRALSLAERACEIGRRSESDQLAMFLDTLALAQQRTGDSAAALETQREAVERISGSVPLALAEELHERLAEYEKAAGGESRARSSEREAVETED